MSAVTAVGDECIIDQYPDLVCAYVYAVYAGQTTTASCFFRKLVMTCFKNNVLAMHFGGVGVDGGSSLQRLTSSHINDVEIEF